MKVRRQVASFRAKIDPGKRRSPGGQPRQTGSPSMDIAVSPNFTIPISQHLWESRYRNVNSDSEEGSIDDTWQRVAEVLASVEKRDETRWRERFPQRRPVIRPALWPYATTSEY